MPTPRTRYLPSPPSNSPATTFEWITPELAKTWLANANTANRNVMVARVEAYADAMKRGCWHRTHQGIAFGQDGVLYDGQHRLLAIVKAGVGVEMAVTRGLVAESREAIDTGAFRSAADNLAIVEGITLNRTFAAALNVIWMVTVAKSISRNASTRDLRETLFTHFAGVETMRSIFSPQKRGITRCGFVAGFIYAYPTNPEKVAQSAEKYYVGADLGEGEPMFVLRDFALRGGHKDHDRNTFQMDFTRSLSAIASSLDGVKRVRVLGTVDSFDQTPFFHRFGAAHRASAETQK